MVEAQHVVSTRKLVDSDAEQQVLEQLIDDKKPPSAAGPDLHYLLHTPFRYPPLRHGSRFGGRTERGIWYGSESPATAFAEVAFYRLLFFDGSDAHLPRLHVELSAFWAPVRTRAGVDLVEPPFGAHRQTIGSRRTAYHETQRLGHEMRKAGVEVFRYPSARCGTGGANVGVFEPKAFSSRRPRGFANWLCVIDREHVELAINELTERREQHAPRSYRFTRAHFEVDGCLPSPAP